MSDELGSMDAVTPGEGDPIAAVYPVTLRDPIDPAMDLSGVAVHADCLVFASDAGRRLLLLRRSAPAGAWEDQQRLVLAKQDEGADLRSLAFAGDRLYALGSHARRRKHLKPELTARRNRDRLLQIDAEPAANRLYRIGFDAALGRLDWVTWIDLSKRLRKDPLLRPFCKLPAGENGVELAGVACAGEEIFLGFRGPVLRDNLVPVMRLHYDRPRDYRLLFVRLAGQGIRDMVALRQGFLLLAGPVSDAPGPFGLWWWDGEDQIGGRDVQLRPALPLGEVSALGGALVEGMALCAETSSHADLMLIYDTGNSTQVVAMQVALPVEGRGWPSLQCQEQTPMLGTERHD